MASNEVLEALNKLLILVEGELDFHYRISPPWPDPPEEQDKRMHLLVAVASAELALRHGFDRKKALKRLAASAENLYRGSHHDIKKAMKQAKEAWS